MNTKAIIENPSHFGPRGRFWIADFRLSEQEKLDQIRSFLCIDFSPQIQNPKSEIQNVI
jgi:hypothetical protein